MRDLFPGHFTPTAEQFDEMWRTAIIVPDANILLHTLRYDANTRREVLDTLRSLKAQVWIPYQVGLEFMRNWRAVDADNRDVYATVQKLVGEAGNALEAAYNAASRHQTIDAKAEREKIKQFMDGLRSSLEEAQKQHPDKSSAEAIVDEIADLIGDSIGEKPTPKLIEQWENEGKKRFEASIPPGYMDRNKDGIDKYGDLFVWKEILARGAEKNLPTIMITDDKKEDIVWIVKGERVGPRPELIEEYRNETGNSFYSYPFDTFLKHAKKYVSSELSDATIEAVKKDARDAATASFLKLWGNRTRHRQPNFGEDYAKVDENELDLQASIEQLEASHTNAELIKLLEKSADAVRLRTRYANALAPATLGHNALRHIYLDPNDTAVNNLVKIWLSNTKPPNQDEGGGNDESKQLGAATDEGVGED
jgi:hypothetical protein